MVMVSRNPMQAPSAAVELGPRGLLDGHWSLSLEVDTRCFIVGVVVLQT